MPKLAIFFASMIASVTDLSVGITRVVGEEELFMNLPKKPFDSACPDG